mgnify:FL=1
MVITKVQEAGNGDFPSDTSRMSHVRLDVRTCADFGTRVGSVSSALVDSHLKSLDPLVTEDKFDVLSDTGVRYTCTHFASAGTN